MYLQRKKERASRAERERKNERKDPGRASYGWVYVALEVD
jgi:hypothetical protein